MQGPSQEFRTKVMGEIKERRLGEAGVDDDQVAAVISLISDEIGGDVGIAELEGQAPEDILAAVDAWAALLSDTMGRSEASANVLPGWAIALLAALRVAVTLLRVPLQAAAKELGASSHSITVGRKSGVAVSLTWPT